MNRALALKAPLTNPSNRVRIVQENTFCQYNHRDCMQNCVEGYNYCIRHILENKTAPFKQCAFITKSGRRCPIGAPKQERKDGFCTDHARKSLLARQRLSRKRRPRETPDGLVEELAALNSGTLDWMNNDHKRVKTPTDSLASRALEYASSSDSEMEPTLVEQSWRDDGDSDAESIDSDQEDMLKYAGVYTTEEVAQILRDKLIRLQALYIDQFKRLRHVLLSRRSQYLQAYKSERDTLGTLKLYKKDPFQKKKYEKLCAMKRYHKKYGKEALLQKQSTERRMKATDGMEYSVPSFPKCIFVDEGLSCSSRVVPLSKYCQKHILHDISQVLYHPCPFADSQCGRPVPTLFDTELCSLHQQINPMKEPETVNLDVKLKQEDLHEAEHKELLQDTDITSMEPFVDMEIKLEVDDDVQDMPQGTLRSFSHEPEIKQEDGGGNSRLSQEINAAGLRSPGQDEEEDGQGR